MDADAGRERRLRQPGDELARVDEGGVGLVPDASEVGRRGDLGADRGFVEDLVLVAVALEQLRGLLDPLDLVRLERDAEVAGQLEVAVDAEALDVGDEPVEVLVTEPLELRHLVGEAGQSILDPVRERAEREAAVSPARAEADRLGLEDDDVAAGVVGLRVQRRPEPREAAADDAEVGLGLPFERGCGSRRGSASSQYGRTVASAKAARCASVGRLSGQGNATAASLRSETRAGAGAPALAAAVDLRSAGR